MEGFEQLIYKAMRDGFRDYLEQNSIVEEIDFEGALVDALVAWLELEEPSVKDRLRKLIASIDEE